MAKKRNQIPLFTVSSGAHELGESQSRMRQYCRDHEDDEDGPIRRVGSMFVIVGEEGLDEVADGLEYEDSYAANPEDPESEDDSDPDDSDPDDSDPDSDTDFDEDE